jgi:hypothetical protein
MPFRVRRRSHRDGSRWASLPRRSGGCLALTAFPPDASPFREGLQGFPAPDHPVRTTVEFRPLAARDGPLELLCLLWPHPSGLGHAVRWHLAVSRGRSHTGCAGGPPRHVHAFRNGPCSRTPPRRSGFPARSWRFLRTLRARRADRAGRTAEAGDQPGRTQRVSPRGRVDRHRGVRALLRADGR